MEVWLTALSDLDQKMSVETVRLEHWVIDPRVDGSAESKKKPCPTLKDSADVSQSIDPHLCGFLFLVSNLFFVCFFHINIQTNKSKS